MNFKTEPPGHPDRGLVIGYRDTASQLGYGENAGFSPISPTRADPFRPLHKTSDPLELQRVLKGWMSRRTTA
ncbi:hypothetical protein [Amycolatopsis sp. cmx-11-32]|uniref:hypothetical protein n=1 Tax=Amycolatopsis sp. cmx-11-32 TaxID=2785796 RepID=UPI0039E65711